jgi:hypothetical protein
MQTITVNRIGHITRITHRDTSDFVATIHLDPQEKEKLVRDLIGSMDGKDQIRLFGRYAAGQQAAAAAAVPARLQYPTAEDSRQMNARLQQVLAAGEHLDDVPVSLRILYDETRDAS